jgi:hypothetical protein
MHGCYAAPRRAAPRLIGPGFNLRRLLLNFVRA